MSEINENNNVQTEEGTDNTAGTIVIEQPSTGKKILKWVLKGLALVATGLGGFLLGRNSAKDDDSSDDSSAEAENPKED